eukprot:3420319-Pyramimonas_sp.AAC.1
MGWSRSFQLVRRSPPRSFKAHPTCYNGVCRGEEGGAEERPPNEGLLTSASVLTLRNTRVVYLEHLGDRCPDSRGRSEDGTPLSLPLGDFTASRIRAAHGFHREFMTPMV